MGLDQYAYRVKMKNVKNDFDFERGRYNDATGMDDLGNDLDFDYWRKFYPLDNWMRGIYSAKGGTGDFNCNPVRLTEEDLDNLHTAAQSLDFYAGNYYNDSQKEKEEEYGHLMKFIAKAKQAIDEGDAVYYDNWW